ncbi:hypothetical protein MJG53_010298 [Ovis ammon polii x Ovis aries]|uniref:Uncharacterized protein n=1 Tax=Ovis ammon polii x Ovis aries TaxID=2918886 RepID=A0ACB9UT45_9CETA|nr:hypothetical protein MJG53_010298 [Ovis ammon polii x Ovis aries]
MLYKKRSRHDGKPELHEEDEPPVAATGESPCTAVKTQCSQKTHYIMIIYVQPPLLNKTVSTLKRVGLRPPPGARRLSVRKFSRTKDRGTGSGRIASGLVTRKLSPETIANAKADELRSPWEELRSVQRISTAETNFVGSHHYSSGNQEPSRALSSEHAQSVSARQRRGEPA